MKRLNTKLAALLAAAALAAALTTGCAAPAASSSAAASQAASSSEAASAQAATSETASSEAASSEAASAAAINVTFTVVDADGNATELALEATAGEILGDALLAAGVISQEEHDAGFVTTVSGMTADWDKDKAYWSLLDANGEMTPVGISDIALADGDSYSFAYTAG